MKNLLSLLLPVLAGLIFAVGLAVAGMTQNSKVVNFLDVSGDWDPSLGFVMVGAIGVHTLAYRLLPGLTEPWLGGRFLLPTRQDFDPRLIVGAVMFGLGWGLAGYCPGPAVVSATSGGREPLIFLASMLAGMVLFQLFDRAAVAREAAKQQSPT